MVYVGTGEANESIDSRYGAGVLVSKDGGTTLLHVTHSIDEALTLSDRILVFARPGRVAADVKIDDVARTAGRETLRREIYAAIEGVNGGVPADAAA